MEGAETAWGGGDVVREGRQEAADGNDADPEGHTCTSLTRVPKQTRGDMPDEYKFLSVRFSGQIYHSSTQIRARCWGARAPGIPRPHR